MTGTLVLWLDMVTLQQVQIEEYESTISSGSCILKKEDHKFTTYCIISVRGHP